MTFKLGSDTFTDATPRVTVPIAPQPIARPSPNVTQIFVAVHDWTPDSLYALRSDGSIWLLHNDTWRQLPPIPD